MSDPFGGIPIVVNRNLRWDQVLVVRKPDRFICGELGHVEFAIYKVAWKEAVKREFAKGLAQLAKSLDTE